MKELRRQPRRHPLTYFRVTDRNSGAILGRVVDFSTEGFRLISQSSIDPHRDFDLSLELPVPVEGSNELACRAQSVWCERDINPDYYAAGFSLEKLSLEERRRLEYLQLSHCFQH